MASKQVNIIAIITPRAGKVDRVAELLSEMCSFVKDNEPDTLKYELNREVNKKTGVEELVMLESYKDMGAVKTHGASKEFKAFYKKMQDEDLVTGPTQLKFVKPVAGFVSRL